MLTPVAALTTLTPERAALAAFRAQFPGVRVETLWTVVDDPGFSIVAVQSLRLAVHPSCCDLFIVDHSTMHAARIDSGPIL